MSTPAQRHAEELLKALQDVVKGLTDGGMDECPGYWSAKALLETISMEQNGEIDNVAVMERKAAHANELYNCMMDLSLHLQNYDTDNDDVNESISEAERLNDLILGLKTDTDS